MQRCLLWFLANALTLVPTAALATFHTFKIQQIYSNAAGTLQYVVLQQIGNLNGEHLFSGHSLTITRNGQSTQYTFGTDLPSNKTAKKYVLIGTAGLATLGLITPDYVIPNGFLPLTDADVNFAEVDSVAYSALPTDGVSALDRGGGEIQNVATNFAGVSASVPAGAVVPEVVPEPVVNYEGLWWKSPEGSESGWGINFAHQGNTLFATWFTHGADGKPLWLAMTAERTAPGVYKGDLFTTTGPAFNAVPFNSAAVTETTVGTATLTFADARNATFAYTINLPSLAASAVVQTKTITRQEFATPVPTCTYGAQPNLALAGNYQDLWWRSPAGSESGWGINFTHQGDIIFATWFTYGLDGKPLWLAVVASRTAPGVYAGDLFTSTGPALNAVPFDSATVVETTVGTATFTVVDGNNVTFAYTVNGVSQTKPITRQVFAAPAATTCQ